MSLAVVRAIQRNIAAITNNANNTTNITAAIPITATAFPMVANETPSAKSAPTIKAAIRDQPVKTGHRRSLNMWVRQKRVLITNAKVIGWHENRQMLQIISDVWNFIQAIFSYQPCQNRNRPQH